MRMEKRLYNRGFHVSYNYNKSSGGIKKVEPASQTNEDLALQQVNPDHVDELELLTVSDLEPAKIIDNTAQELIIITPDVEPATIDDAQITDVSNIEIILENTERGMFNRTDTKKNGSSSTSDDEYLYLIAGLVALSAFGLIKVSRKKGAQLARWANSNKYKSRSILILGQFGLAYVGYAIGLEMSKLGFNFSNTSQYVLSGVTAAAVVGSLFYERKKSKSIDLNAFFKKKAGQIIVGATLFASTMGIGNGIEMDRTQISGIGQVVELTASMGSSSYDFPTMEEVNAPLSAAEHNKAVGVIVFWILLGICLSALLVILTCWTFCTAGSWGFLVLLGSILVLVIFNWGMNKWHKNFT